MRCVIYVRLSLLREGEDSFSPERQEAECRALAAARGWEVVGVESDVSVSAYKKGLERPALKRVIDRAKRGEAEVVVAYSISRLARSTVDLWRLVDTFEKNGVSVTTVADSLDTSTPAARLMTTVLAALAELESATIGERVKSAHRVKAEQGKFPAGRHRHLGYTRDGQVVEEEAAWLSQAADRIIGGESVLGTAKWLNEQGARTTTGKLFIGQSLHASLTSGRIAGLRRMPNGDLLNGAWEPILSRERWTELMDAIGDRHRPRSAREPALLSGLVRCAECDSGMYPARGGDPPVFYYSCAKRMRGYSCGSVSVNKDRLDSYVVERFLAEMPEVMRLSSPASKVAELEAEAADLTRRLTALSSARFVDESITEAEFRAAREELVARARLVEGDLEVARSADLGGDLVERWESADVAERRAMLGKAIHQVRVSKSKKRGGRFDPSRVEVRWRWTTLLTASDVALDGLSPDEVERAREEYFALGREV